MLYKQSFNCNGDVFMMLKSGQVFKVKANFVCTITTTTYGLDIARDMARVRVMFDEKLIA